MPAREPIGAADCAALMQKALSTGARPGHRQRSQSHRPDLDRRAAVANREDRCLFVAEKARRRRRGSKSPRCTPLLRARNGVLLDLHGVRTARRKAVYDPAGANVKRGASASRPPAPAASPPVDESNNCACTLTAYYRSVNEPLVPQRRIAEEPHGPPCEDQRGERTGGAFGTGRPAKPSRPSATRKRERASTRRRKIIRFSGGTPGPRGHSRDSPSPKTLHALCSTCRRPRRSSNAYAAELRRWRLA